MKTPPRGGVFFLIEVILRIQPESMQESEVFAIVP
jgi:hypothetical protein